MATLIRPEDGAIFAPTQVRRSGTPRILASVVLIALGGLIGIGALDRVLGQGAPVTPQTGGGPGPSKVQATAPGHTREDPGQRYTNGPEIGPSRTGPPGQPAEVLHVDPRPAGSHLFVHGEVFSLNVVVVVVSLEDASGNVADLQSVKLQGGSTAFLLGPNARFDALFNVPDELMGEGLWVHANAYDTYGRILDAVQQPVIAPILDPA